MWVGLVTTEGENLHLGCSRPRLLQLFVLDTEERGGRRPPISAKGMESLCDRASVIPWPPSPSVAISAGYWPARLALPPVLESPVKLFRWNIRLTSVQTCVMLVTSIAVDASLVYQKTQIGLKG